MHQQAMQQITVLRRQYCSCDKSSAAAGEAKSASDIKVGVIYIGDENEGYTAAHMAGIDRMMSNLGLS